MLNTEKFEQMAKKFEELGEAFGKFLIEEVCNRIDADCTNCPFSDLSLCRYSDMSGSIGELSEIAEDIREVAKGKWLSQ